MATVYILKSSINNRYYVGSTNDLMRRLGEHNKGKTKSIRFIKPFELVFSQEYNTLVEARRVEYKIKKLKSRTIIEKIISDKFIRLGW